MLGIFGRAAVVKTAQMKALLGQSIHNDPAGAALIPADLMALEPEPAETGR
jgi:hypothetical protein